MRGGIEETSASFEARSAPRSYPTAAAEAGLPRGAILMDAGYGSDTQLRTDVTALGFHYVAGILSNTSVWAQGTAPLPPKPWSGRGRPPKLMRRDGEHQPTSVKALALALEQAAWTEIAWREGVADRLTSRFARVRVRAAHRDYWLGEPRPQEWLLIEWPEGEKEPTKYRLSPCRRTLVSCAWLNLPSSGGVSSATTRSSSKNSGLGTTRVAAGAAFTTMPVCAWRPMASWLPNG